MVLWYSHLPCWWRFGVHGSTVDGLWVSELIFFFCASHAIKQHCFLYICICSLFSCLEKIFLESCFWTAVSCPGLWGIPGGGDSEGWPCSYSWLGGLCAGLSIENTGHSPLAHPLTCCTRECRRLCFLGAVSCQVRYPAACHLVVHHGARTLTWIWETLRIASVGAAHAAWSGGQPGRVTFPRVTLAALIPSASPTSSWCLPWWGSSDLPHAQGLPCCWFSSVMGSWSCLPSKFSSPFHFAFCPYWATFLLPKGTLVLTLWQMWMAWEKAGDTS